MWFCSTYVLFLFPKETVVIFKSFFLAESYCSPNVPITVNLYSKVGGYLMEETSVNQKLQPKGQCGMC